MSVTDELLESNDDEVKASPFIPDTSSVRGFVHEVESGRLREVV